MSVGTVIPPRSSVHNLQRFQFLRHLLEMTLAMTVGMFVGAAVFLTAVGMQLDEALRRHAVSFMLVMAFSMTLPMVAWMRHRGHAWRGCFEMAAAMVAPAIPLICLRLADVITGRLCSLYCALTILAMVLVMVYRRREYGNPGV